MQHQPILCSLFKQLKLDQHYMFKNKSRDSKCMHAFPLSEYHWICASPLYLLKHNKLFLMYLC